MKFFNEYGKMDDRSKPLSDLNSKIFKLIDEFLENECQDCSMIELTLIESLIPDCISIHTCFSIAKKHIEYTIEKRKKCQAELKHPQTKA